MEKKKKIIILICTFAVILIILAILLKNKNNMLQKNNIEIIDATYACANSPEKFYEDDNYIYYFPCKQSDSVFVKFSNGNKLLVTRALDEGKVTIDMLLKAGLNVNKVEK